ncbi:MAG: hypothetical protein JW863_23795 [Chitinispirillaceae bacterium]|nr:hypothetical protein [Chitinispirillaceae bacterium]
MTRKLQRFAEQRGNETDDSLLSRFDNRTLLVVWGSFILALVSVDKYDIVRTLSFIAFPVFTLVVVRFPLLPLLKRLVMLSPFIIVMAAANPFLDRTAVTTVYGFTISTGMMSAAVIMLKATMALSVMLALDRCISIAGLCNALRRFGVPGVFTTQLLLLHRYAFLIIGEAATMIKARDLRAAGKRGKGPVDTANLIGSLLLRSAERSERIYKAMLARGFNGTLPVASENRFGLADALFIASTLSCFALLRFIF